jgi:hypothetical protein
MGNVGTSPLEQRVDLGPESLPLLPLGFGELGERLMIADAGEVGTEPSELQILECRSDIGLGFRGPGLKLACQDSQFGPEPAEGLRTQSGVAGLIGSRHVLASPGEQQCHAASRIVAVMGDQVVGQLRIGLESPSKQTSGGRMKVTVVTEIGEFQPTLGVRGSVVASEDGRETHDEHSLPLGRGQVGVDGRGDW